MTYYTPDEVEPGRKCYVGFARIPAEVVEVDRNDDGIVTGFRLRNEHTGQLRYACAWPVPKAGRRNPDATPWVFWLVCPHVPYAADRLPEGGYHIADTYAPDKTSDNYQYGMEPMQPCPVEFLL